MGMLRITAFIGEDEAMESPDYISRAFLVSNNVVSTDLERWIFYAFDIVEKQLVLPRFPIMVIPLSPRLLGSCVEVYEGVYFVPFSLWSLAVYRPSIVLVNDYFCRLCLSASDTTFESLSLMSLATLTNFLHYPGSMSQHSKQHGLLVYAVQEMG